MEVLKFVWWRFCGRDFSWEYHVPAFCIPNAQLCGQNLPTLEMKIPKTWMCMNRWRAPPYSEGSEDIIICNDCLAYIGTVHVFYVLVVHVYTYFNCTCLFQAAGGILCCALVLQIWLGFRPLPFVWSPSSCCARVSPMLSGVLITCNALRWSWHWHLKPSIHRCSSLEIQWLRDDVSRLSVCVSTHTFETCWNKAEWVVEPCWKFGICMLLQWIDCWAEYVWNMSNLAFWNSIPLDNATQVLQPENLSHTSLVFGRSADAYPSIEEMRQDAQSLPLGRNGNSTWQLGLG